MLLSNVMSMIPPPPLSTASGSAYVLDFCDRLYFDKPTFFRYFHKQVHLLITPTFLIVYRLPHFSFCFTVGGAPSLCSATVPSSSSLSLRCPSTLSSSVGFGGRSMSKPRFLACRVNSRTCFQNGRVSIVWRLTGQRRSIRAMERRA